MLTKEEFIDLGTTEQLWTIYSALFKTDESGIGGVFNPDTPRVQPVQPKIDTPEGFEEIFGPEPDKSDSAHRAVWLRNLEKFEGLVDLTSQLDFSTKAEMSHKLGIGVPIAYSFGGQERITFSGKPKFFRPFSWYKDAYQTLITIARNA